MTRIIMRVTTFLLIICLSMPVISITETVQPELLINKEVASLAKGKTLQLRATIQNVKGKISWESEDTSVATINTSGLITGKSDGTTRIKCILTLADADALFQYCTITVYTPVTTIKIPSTIKVDAGYTSLPLDVKLFPEDATDKTVIWSSSDDAIATVDNSGIISGINPGRCKITAVANSAINENNIIKTSICNVTVQQPVESISLNVNELLIAKGAKQKIEATVIPNDAANKKVTWTTSDDSIVSVTNGYLTAKNTGAAIVKATSTRSDGSVVESNANVLVYQPVRSITINKPDGVIYPKDRFSLDYSIIPEDAYYQEVSLESSDPSIAAIQNGTIIAKKAGRTTITVKSQEPQNGNTTAKKATLSITVAQPVKSFSVSGDSIVWLNKKSQINVRNIKPSTATNKKLEYQSSDNRIVSVSNTGVIEGKEVGKAKITVSAADKQGASSSYYVYALKKERTEKSFTGFKAYKDILNSLMRGKYTEDDIGQIMALPVFEYILNRALMKKDDESIQVDNGDCYCYFDNEQIWCCFPRNTKYSLLGLMYYDAYGLLYLDGVAYITHYTVKNHDYVTKWFDSKNYKTESITSDAFKNALSDISSRILK